MPNRVLLKRDLVANFVVRILLISYGVGSVCWNSDWKSNEPGAILFYTSKQWLISHCLWLLVSTNCSSETSIDCV